MYYKTMSDEYILAVGISGDGCVGWAICSGYFFEPLLDFIEIEETEYKQIIEAIAVKPPRTDSTDYRLREDLTWEEYEVEPEPEPELDESEAFDIIFGGGGE